MNNEIVVREIYDNIRKLKNKYPIPYQIYKDMSHVLSQIPIFSYYDCSENKCQERQQIRFDKTWDDFYETRNIKQN